MTKNGKWTRVLAYRDFYDVPRAFLVEPKPHLLLLFDCRFDDSLDEYSPAYSVFVLRLRSAAEMPDNWRTLDAFKVGPIGQVLVSAVRFDETRRKEALVETLFDLAASAERSGHSWE